MATIFAVSSGRPPAAIAVIRISGPAAFRAATTLAGVLPPPRVARLRTLRDAGGAMLDQALVLVFPGPASATGEDLVEFHCHGGRAVVAAVEAALAVQSRLRQAEPGEFTRRTLASGRIDLTEAEGLADLLAADTERQRVAALSGVEGRLGALVRTWLDRIARLSAHAEAQLDVDDEGELGAHGLAAAAIGDAMRELAAEIGRHLAQPSVERLRDGLSVVIAGPPNAGKSTLLNHMADRDAAIVSPMAGTTRDRIEVHVQRSGLPFVLTDTAGLRIEDVDPIEREGIVRAEQAMAAADILLWLSDAPPPAHANALWVHARADMVGRTAMPHGPVIAIAANRADSIEALWELIVAQAATLVPAEDSVAFNARQRGAAGAAREALGEGGNDPLLQAEALRRARQALADLLGINATEAMLDALFGQFCLGK